MLSFDSPWNELTGVVAFDNMIEGIFFIDILLEFRTTYIDEQTGEEIYDPRKIAKTYIKGIVFYIDVMAIVPFDRMLGPVVLTG